MLTWLLIFQLELLQILCSLNYLTCVLPLEISNSNLGEARAPQVQVYFHIYSGSYWIKLGLQNEPKFITVVSFLFPKLWHFQCLVSKYQWKSLWSEFPLGICLYHSNSRSSNQQIQISSHIYSDFHWIKLELSLPLLPSSRFSSFSIVQFSTLITDYCFVLIFFIPPTSRSNINR